MVEKPRLSWDNQVMAMKNKSKNSLTLINIGTTPK